MTRQSLHLPPACYILSAERATLSPEENATRTRALRSRLSTGSGLVRPALGSWEGALEASNVIYVPRGEGARVRALVLEEMRYFEQAAVMYVAPSRRCYLIRGPGFSREYIGRLVGQPDKPTDVPGWTYVPELRTYYVARKGTRGEVVGSHV